MSTADIQLSVVFGGQYSFEKLQSDYEQTDTLARDYIKNKPDLVNFVAETVTAETVIFDENPTGELGALNLQYSPDEKTLEFGLADGGKLQIGKEMFEEYTNIDTVTITNGMIVSTAAIPGNRKGIKRTDFTNLTSIRSIVGMVTVGSIAVNGAGRVTTKGIINDLNTNGWAEGSQLWGNPAVLGGWSGNKPAKPQYAVQIGQVVVASATVGSVELNVAKDVKFSDLADVNGSTNLIDDTDTIPKRDSDGIIREITVADIKADFKTDTDALYEPLLGFTPENTANKGQANGYASLDGDGLVPAAQLPSFVDDLVDAYGTYTDNSDPETIIELWTDNTHTVPVEKYTGKIYVDVVTRFQFRWSGSVWGPIRSGPVQSVSGKTGNVLLVKGDVGLGNVDNTSDVNKPVSTAQQNALDLKIDKTLSSEITTIGYSETMAVKASDNIWKRITWSNIKATLKTYFETLFVTLTGAQNVAGVKTFTDKPIVPTPTGSTEAANKGYVDSAVVGAMPAATKALAPELAYYTRVLADSGNIQDLNKLTELYIKNLQLLDSTVFLWSGVAGMKNRTSGSNVFTSKLYNMANKVQQFSTELATNGNFTSDLSSWTITNGGWVWNAGTAAVLSPIGAYSNLQQNKLTVGKTYHITVTFTVVAGEFYVKAGNSGNFTAFNSGTAVTRTVSSVCAGDGFIVIQAGPTFVGSVDSYSIKQMDWIEGTNDAVQTTEANQPYVGGLIAPNEVRKLKNYPGVLKRLSFTRIAFASIDTFSATFVFKRYGQSSGGVYELFLSSILGANWIGLAGASITLRNSNSDISTFSNVLSANQNGRINIFTVVSGGNNNVSLYINGVYHSSITFVASFFFDQLLTEGTGIDRMLNGELLHAQIHNRAISASEIQAQHDFLRLQIPEIEGIAIGNQYWPTSNYEGVVAGDGVAIPQVTDNAVWAALTTLAWDYHTSSVDNGAIYGKIYNGYAADKLALKPPIGYRVMSRADWLQLSSVIGANSNKLKVTGTDYWAAANGTNETGFSAIGGGYRNADGTFSTLKSDVWYWTSDKYLVKIASGSGTITVTDGSSTLGIGAYIRLIRNQPAGSNERTITSTTIVSDIASTANSTQIPFGYSVASIRLKTTANLANIKVELWNNFYSGTPTLVATLITSKTANNTTMVFPVLADVPSLLQDGTLRITATGTNTFETIVEYNLQKNTF